MGMRTFIKVLVSSFRCHHSPTSSHQQTLEFHLDHVGFHDHAFPISSKLFLGGAADKLKAMSRRGRIKSSVRRSSVPSLMPKSQESCDLDRHRQESVAMKAKIRSVGPSCIIQ